MIENLYLEIKSGTCKLSLVSLSYIQYIQKEHPSLYFIRFGTKRHTLRLIAWCLSSLGVREHGNFCYLIFFRFLSRPSSALICWSSTQVLVEHWGTFCAGGNPNVHFSFFLPGGCGGVWTPDLLITRRTFLYIKGRIDWGCRVPKTTILGNKHDCQLLASDGVWVLKLGFLWQVLQWKFFLKILPNTVLHFLETYVFVYIGLTT